MLRVRGTAAAMCAAAIVGIAAGPTVGLSQAQEAGAVDSVLVPGAAGNPLEFVSDFVEGLQSGGDGAGPTAEFIEPAKEHFFVTKHELRLDSRDGTPVNEVLHPGATVQENDILAYEVHWAFNSRVKAGDFFTFKVPSNLVARYPINGLLLSGDHYHIADLEITEGGFGKVVFTDEAENRDFSDVPVIKIKGGLPERSGPETKVVMFEVDGTQYDLKLDKAVVTWTGKDSAGHEKVGRDNWDDLVVVAPVGSFSAERRGELSWHVGIPASNIDHRGVEVVLNATGDWKFSEDPFGGAGSGIWNVVYNDGKSLKLSLDSLPAGQALDLPLVSGRADNPGAHRLEVQFYSDRYNGVGQSTALSQDVVNIALPSSEPFPVEPEEITTPTPEPQAPATPTPAPATPSATASAAPTTTTQVPVEEDQIPTSAVASRTSTPAPASSDQAAESSAQESGSKAPAPQDPLDDAGQGGTDAPPADQPWIDERRVAQHSVRVEEPPTFVENMSLGSVALNAVAVVAVLGGAALLIRLR